MVSRSQASSAERPPRPLRRRPAVSLALAGDGALHRQAGIFLPQGQGRFHKVQVRAAGHAGDEMPVAPQVQSFQLPGDALLEGQTAGIPLVGSPGQLGPAGWPVKQQVISRSMTAPPPFFILWPIVAEGGAAVNRAAQIGAAKFFACTLLHFSRSLL